tara:strand:+ start:159 stop:638 length:480 start_codon:yes stop_codon:yes gene_type:complete
MSSQSGPDSQAHRPLFAGGLQFSDGTSAEDFCNDPNPSKIYLLVALSATSLARARGYGDDPLAAMRIAQEILHGAVYTAEGLVQVDDRGLPVHMEDAHEEACPSGVEASRDTGNAQSVSVHARVEQSSSEPPPGIHGAGGSIATLAESRRMPVSNTAEL